MPEPSKIISQLKKEFEKNSSVVAFVLVGSQARETIYAANQYSDLEAYIITKDHRAKKLEQELPNLVNKLGNVLFSLKHQISFVAVYEDLLRLELPVVKQSDMVSVFNRPKAQAVKVLIDKTNGKLEKILNKRPENIGYAKIFQDKVINFWYWQILGVQYFKKGEIYNTRAILNIHASALIKLFELLNEPQIVLLETNKRVEQFLTEEQLNLLKEITVDYDLNEIKRALIKVMEIFSGLAKQIKNKYGYSYDESIEKKTKPRLLKLLV